jgi:hypothetical protein
MHCSIENNSFLRYLSVFQSSKKEDMVIYRLFDTSNIEIWYYIWFDILHLYVCIFL